LKDNYQGAGNQSVPTVLAIPTIPVVPTVTAVTAVPFVDVV
jgi:hypothetical protein